MGLSLKKLAELVKPYDGEVLSTRLVDVHTKLRFKCKEGHTWLALPYKIKSGEWCPVCDKSKTIGNYTKHNIESIYEFAEKKGITCVSKKYADINANLQWKCANGHKFAESFHTVSRRKNICKECPQLPYNEILILKKMERMREIAAGHGGELLSEKYGTGHLRFRCKVGHIWRTKYWGVKSGSWCPRCFIEKLAEKHRLTINKVQMFAKENGGKCLSEGKDYKNVFSPLKWECSKGHKFSEHYLNVKQRKNFCMKCCTSFNGR